MREENKKKLLNIVFFLLFILLLVFFVDSGFFWFFFAGLILFNLYKKRDFIISGIRPFWLIFKENWKDRRIQSSSLKKN